MKIFIKLIAIKTICKIQYFNDKTLNVEISTNNYKTLKS